MNNMLQKADRSLTGLKEIVTTLLLTIGFAVGMFFGTLLAWEFYYRPSPLRIPLLIIHLVIMGVIAVNFGYLMLKKWRKRGRET